mmetsp:Transcript_35458/g.72515  ORF Transcript_35458/g.72515 Transcript_35458/m.72515 type:complete len:289 (-) Transcript_35458:117-983(-)|eukprot:CAMPEP_0113389648 /NCGR_PEP_ID=MMETSP0013_2-20120614/9738_1 /TAXON_ID=2843 ORGANISM="Skeletonema costatum, Strain 1716" /NCGR_SAMPLE_ID=MMETSP0013_2 /ASSEMBLY_ACC=CAM_ASM_000158 /LENGTH=288 /DNA_ID=CAMNT_0000272737 /DNA_START=91 /DNA_END=957 /DNA_ORIENTATION=+ /assembly_acc=CAM_ASM_000158
MGKIISGITSLLLLGGIGIALWYFLGKPENLSEAKDGLGDAYNKTKDQIDKFDFGDVLEDLSDLDWGQFFNDDPFAGNTTVTLWDEQFIERDDGGLQLTLVNSLSADWQEEFEVAVADWSMSDALTLDVVVEPVDDAWDNDKKCKRQDDKMVVCNGNFGDTGWVGINENEVMGGRIISSVAKMNEYYLNKADFDHRRFTMCHEIGHGFGLPHTDENPYNKNLNDCLDYTDNPSSNVLPGEVNMIKLQEVYLATEREKRLLRRVENKDGSVTETIGWMINEDEAEASSL